MKKFLILVLMLSMVATMAFAQGAAEQKAESDVIKIALIIENTIDD